MLDDSDAHQFLATSSAQQAFKTGNETIVASSGDRVFDYALAHTLSHLTDALEVLPGFAYFDDFDGENAYASKLVRLDRADGTVLFGTRYLRRLLSTPALSQVGVITVCAHEFGHILQYKNKIDGLLRAVHPTVKRLELHADFLAGYYAGYRKRSEPDFPAAFFASTQHWAGDELINHPQHHGRPDERAAAVVQGFKTSYQDRKQLPEAIQIGMNFVQTL